MKSMEIQDITIYIEDDHFLVAEKPSGIATQPLKNSSSPSLAARLAKDFPELKNVGGSDWGAVHRLDVDTSGLVIFARDQKTYDYFRKAFSSNKIEKEYRALVQGHIEKPGKITWPIGSDPKSAKRVKVFKDKKDAIRNKAQEAMTFYKPVGATLRGCPEINVPTLSGQAQGPAPTTWLSVHIKTGRRHQIRAHLAAAGYPIVGDALYGKKEEIKDTRLHLHAYRLQFSHPDSRETIQVISNYAISL